MIKNIWNICSRALALTLFTILSKLTMYHISITVIRRMRMKSSLCRTASKNRVRALLLRTNFFNDDVPSPPLPYLVTQNCEPTEQDQAELTKNGQGCSEFKRNIMSYSRCTAWYENSGPIDCSRMWWSSDSIAVSIRKARRSYGASSSNPSAEDYKDRMRYTAVKITPIIDSNIPCLLLMTVILNYQIRFPSHESTQAGGYKRRSKRRRHAEVADKLFKRETFDTERFCLPTNCRCYTVPYPVLGLKSFLP